MFKKQTALKIAVIVLVAVALMDLIRGYMHTFNIWYASENIAQMTQTPDTMNLMNTFGITNFLTAGIFLLIVIKAKELAPYVLLLIPTTYLIGIVSARVTGVAAMQVSAWNGQYMLFVYWAVCILVGVNYFISARRENGLKENQ